MWSGAHSPSGTLGGFPPTEPRILSTAAGELAIIFGERHRAVKEVVSGQTGTDVLVYSENSMGLGASYQDMSDTPFCVAHFRMAAWVNSYGVDGPTTGLARTAYPHCTSRPSWMRSSHTRPCEKRPGPGPRSPGCNDDGNSVRDGIGDALLREVIQYSGVTTYIYIFVISC